MSTTDPGRALSGVTAGTRVVLSPGCGTPTTLLRALVLAAADGGPAHGAHISSGLLLDDQGLYEAVARGEIGYDTWHPAGGARSLIDRGLAGYLPLRGSAVPGHLSRHRPDVALVRVSPPDQVGLVSLGPSVSYPRIAVEHARAVIGEIDPAVPRTGAASMLPADRFTALVDSTTPMPAYNGAPPSEESARIAGHILDLLPESPVLQVGIGSVPEALTSRLAEIDGRFRFTGMGSDAMVHLAAAGRLDTDLATGPAIDAVELMGTGLLMEFAHDNPSVGVFPSTTGQSVRHLARLDRFVSVNGAAELDLTGQTASEVVGGRQISGVGGSQDFVEAARASTGGMVIVALTSTTRGTSRIVRRLGTGTLVTLPRHVVDVVVTEWGVADLRGLPDPERAAALIAVAHPDHRAALAGGDDEVAP